jgi:signal transduction histidine kinase
MTHLIRVVVLFILCCLFPALSPGQQNISLNEFKNLKGEHKIRAGIGIAEAMADSPDAMIQFSSELLIEAEKLVPNTPMHAQVARIMGDAYYYADSISMSNKFLLKAIHIAEKIALSDSVFLGLIWNDLGFNQLFLGEKDDAKSSFFKALSYMKSDNSSVSKADVLSNLAQIYHQEGNYESAIRLFNNAYEIDLKNGNRQRQSSSLNSLARMYVDWGKYETGLEFYFKSIELIDSVKERSKLAIRYNNIGMVYQIMQNHTKAIEWIEKAKSIEEEEGAKSKLAIRYCNLANSYLALKQFNKAREYYEKADAYFSEIGLYGQQSKVNIGLGQLYLAQGLNDKALHYFEKALRLAEQSATLPEKVVVSDHLYRFNKQVGDYKKALFYKEMHDQLNDSVFNLNTSKQVEEMQVKYQTAQKEAEITRLESEKELSRKELMFRKRERNRALVGMGALFLFSALMLMLYATVRRQKATLAVQNRELERLNRTLNHLFGIISHDLRNASAAYQSSAKIIGHYLRKGEPEKLLPLAPEIDKNAKNLSSMLENLLYWSVLQIKGVQPEKESINMKEMVKDVSGLLHDQFTAKNNALIVDLSDQNVWCDVESLKIIIRNLLGNANKFTINGNISVAATENGNLTSITIEDTGCGMPPEKVRKFMELKTIDSARGTAGEKGVGLGLLLVAEHVKRNDGTIDIESGVGSGTRVLLTFPSHNSNS